MNKEVKFLWKFKKKNIFFFFFWGGGGGGVQVGGVRVDVNEELKFFVKIQKKFFWGGEIGSGGSLNMTTDFLRYHICKIAEYKIQKRAITQKESYDFLKYSTHHSLSANLGFKSLAFILFEILHLQNCNVKFQKFQRAITQKKII